MVLVAVVHVVNGTGKLSLVHLRERLQRRISRSQLKTGRQSVYVESSRIEWLEQFFFGSLNWFLVRALSALRFLCDSGFLGTVGHITFIVNHISSYPEF